MKKIVISILVIILTFSFVGCRKDPGTTTPATETSDISVDPKNMTVEQILENVSVTKEKAEDGSVVVIFKNNNSFTIPELKVAANFYNKDNVFNGGDSWFFYSVVPGHEYAIALKNHNGEFDSFTVELKPNMQNDEYVSYTDKTRTENEKKDDGKIYVRMFNDSDKKCDQIAVIAVFYKEGKILGASPLMQSTNLEGGKYSVFELEPPKSSDNKYVEYDDYKVFVDFANSKK